MAHRIYLDGNFVIIEDSSGNVINEAPKGKVSYREKDGVVTVFAENYPRKFEYAETAANWLDTDGNAISGGIIAWLRANVGFNPASGGSGVFLNKTGTTIEFTEDAVYNEATYLTSGDLTLDLTAAVKGKVAIVYCNGYMPSISGETFYFASGILKSTALNILSFFYDGTQILLNIANISPLSSPVLSLTTGDEEIEVNWIAITNADNYIVERDTDSGFGTATEIYNGSLLTFTDTGLTNDTTYYYRVKAQGTGYLESGWSITADEEPSAPLDADLIVWWDASDDDTITTPNGNVTVLLDKTSNGNNLAESTNPPVHSQANDTITFDGTARLNADLDDLNFQQTDDFTIVVLGLKLSSTSTGGIVIDNKIAGANPGIAITFSGDNNNLYFTQRTAGTQNFATYNNGSGWDDDVERDYIFVNESGVLKIYDATNTNVGTNGSTSLGAISYTGAQTYLGENSAGAQDFIGSWKQIKVYTRALDSTDRDTELGL